MLERALSHAYRHYLVRYHLDIGEAHFFAETRGQDDLSAGDALGFDYFRRGMLGN